MLKDALFLLFTLLVTFAFATSSLSSKEIDIQKAPQKQKEINPRILSINPNPANDYISVKLESKFNEGFDVSNCTILIGTIDGKIVFKSKSADLSNDQEYKIDIREYLIGNYGISVGNIDGKYLVGTSFKKE